MVVLELVGYKAVEEWRRWLGDTNPTEAAHGTLRQMYGRNTLENVAHGSSTRQNADKVTVVLLNIDLPNRRHINRSRAAHIQWRSRNLCQVTAGLLIGLTWLLLLANG